MNNIANWILAAVQVIVTLITGTIGFFLKRELGRVDNVLHSQRKLELKIADKYVTKDDYNRSIGELLAKTDKIYDMLYELRGEINSDIERNRRA